MGHFPYEEQRKHFRGLVSDACKAYSQLPISSACHQFEHLASDLVWEAAVQAFAPVIEHPGSNTKRCQAIIDGCPHTIALFNHGHSLVLRVSAALADQASKNTLHEVEVDSRGALRSIVADAPSYCELACISFLRTALLATDAVYDNYNYFIEDRLDHLQYSTAYAVYTAFRRHASDSESVIDSVFAFVFIDGEGFYRKRSTSTVFSAPCILV